MKFDAVKDSGGERQVFTTGAQRDIRTGKGRFDLLPPLALKRLACHYENGAVKYSARNWEKGIPVGRMLDSALRHTFAYLAGAGDEDHLSAAAWNLLGVLEYEERRALGMPEYQTLFDDMGPLWEWGPSRPDEPLNDGDGDGLTS